MSRCSDRMPAGQSLKLSSAVVAVTCAATPGAQSAFELSITTQVFGEQVMLAGADPRAAARDRDSTRYTLRTTPILLAAVPDSVEIAGVSGGPDVAPIESYAITLTFSDGAASMFWRVTVETPAGMAPGAPWRVTVPFRHHLGSSAEGAVLPLPVDETRPRPFPRR